MIKEAIKEVISSIPKNLNFYKEIALTVIWAIWLCAFICSCVFEGAAVIHLVSLGSVYVLYGILLCIVALILDLFLGMVTMRIYNKMEERFLNDFVS